MNTSIMIVATEVLAFWWLTFELSGVQQVAK
jgi:hypothetical protein